LSTVLKEKYKSKFVYNPPIPPPVNGGRASANINGNANGTHKFKRRFEPDPDESLGMFLKFCRQNYPAEHYMLFMLGHGVVVGNDIFMFDEHAKTKSISLNQMGKLLRKFKRRVTEQGAFFDLVSFHSCSVSSVEVAYQLHDTADYMLASQGPTFVGSWPYRQVLIRIFNEVERNKNEVPRTQKDIKEMISDIFYYCLFNSNDYLLAGYSHQLTLLDLRQISTLNEPIQKLGAALLKGVNDTANTVARDAILYSHWKSQSFFEEMYTDLHDFCFCLRERIKEVAGDNASQTLQDIMSACDLVISSLARHVPAPAMAPPPAMLRRNASKSRSAAVASAATAVAQTAVQTSLIEASEFVGPAYQYSHGLSIYFPWSEPSADSQILQQYETYKFSKGLSNSWLNFLRAYFAKTRRDTSRVEQDDVKLRDRAAAERIIKELPRDQALQEDIGSLIYNGEGPRGGFALEKSDPNDKTGGSCDCPSIKNYPRDTRSRRDRRTRAQKLPVSETLLNRYAQTEQA